MRTSKNRTPKIRILLAAVSLMLPAGAVASDFIGAWGSDPPAAGEIVVDPPVDRREAMPRWRWIGVKSGDAESCPEPVPAGSWITTSMFEASENLILERFCIYRNPGPPPILRPTIPGLVALQPDMMAVSPLGTDLGEATWEALAEHFLAQVGDAVGDLPLAGGVPPRLSVVDTAADRENDAEDFPGTSPHGYALLNMLDQLLCDSGAGTACVAEVTSRLALAWECFERSQADLGCRDEVNGGFIGHIGELAQAIQAETARWQDVAPPGQSLIINLSLGWESRFGGPQVAVQNMPLAVQAVFRAIEDARCRGALVLAAAGNFQGGPDNAAGPHYPGGWEVRTAPSFAACTGLGLTPDPSHFPGGPGPYNPLVHAAAGVRADDSRLFNSQPAAEPRLVTFADHAAVAAGGGGATEALTGSSVATAVLSAGAAALSYYRSDLAPFEIMNQLHDKGIDVNRSASFCQGGGPGDSCPGPALPVRRVSVCDSVVQACTPLTADCPAQLPTCPIPTSLDLSGLYPADFEDPKLTLQRDWTEVTVPWGPEPACRGEVLLFHPEQVPIDPCPHWQYHDQQVTAWTEPQPGSNPCPNCSLNYASPGTLYLEIDDTYEGDLTDPTLKCGGNTYNLGTGTLVAGDKVRVTGIECQGETPVFLGWTLNGGRSAVTPILELVN